MWKYCLFVTCTLFPHAEKKPNVLLDSHWALKGENERRLSSHVRWTSSSYIPPSDFLHKYKKASRHMLSLMDWRGSPWFPPRDESRLCSLCTLDTDKCGVIGIQSWGKVVDTPTIQYSPERIIGEKMLICLAHRQTLCYWCKNLLFLERQR